MAHRWERSVTPPALVACLLLGCSEPPGACRDGDVAWVERVALDLPERFGRDRDWDLRLAGDGGEHLALTGVFRYEVLVGDEVLSSLDGRDAFVASYGADGTFRWMRSIRGPLDTLADAVEIDGAGNVVVAGSFQGSVDLGGAECLATRGTDMFLVKYGASGEVVWSRCLGGEGHDHGLALAVDASGDIIVAGQFGWWPEGAGIDLGGGSIEPVIAGGVFLAKFSGADGSHVWSVGIGTERDEWPVSVAVDPAGDVLVAGHYQEPSGTAGRNLFVAKRSGRDGALLWSSEPATEGEDFLTDMVVNGSGNVVLSGWSGRRLTATTYEPESALLARLSGSDGAEVWSREFARPDFLGGFAALGVTSAEDVLVTGTFAGAVRCGDGSTVSGVGSQSDAFVARFSGLDGDLQWLRRYGGTLWDLGLGIVVSDSDRWTAAAYIDNTLELALQPLWDAEGPGITLLGGP